MSRLYLNKTICLGLLLLLAGLAWASSDRAAMVVETRGKNVVRFNGEDAPMRTLQVLPQGARVTVDNGAIVRLSYLKSGTKETVTGPCQIEIEAGKSRKISQSGELKSKTNRGSSTDLPSTENLRRTGGALQAYRFTETPDSRLAMLEAVEMQYQRNTRGGKTRFIERQRAYLNAENARKLAWSEAPENLRVKLTQDGAEAAIFNVQGRTGEIPVELVAGKDYKIELITAAHVLAESSFTILTDRQAQDVSRAKEAIRREESADSRVLYVRLLRLESELGLYKEAEKTAEQALNRYPDDPGFLFMAALLKEALGQSEQAAALLRKAHRIESELYR